MKKITIILLSMSIMLFGCKAEDFQDSGVLSIDDYYIIGTNDNASDEVPEIDPYYNDGEFLVFIQPGKPDLGYELTLYVSNRKSTQDAKRIYHIDCDDDDQYCYDSDYFTISCYFLSDMSGECGRYRFDLSNTINMIPYSGYIIAEICHRVQNQCVMSSQRVIFR
ncbi:MAG: hypothetical protein MI864_04220 [Pseudomonadales bacterium]|nr:hypothetical protein [Pseudomonadales bacterium]